MQRENPTRMRDERLSAIFVRVIGGWLTAWWIAYSRWTRRRAECRELRQRHDARELRLQEANASVLGLLDLHVIAHLAFSDDSHPAERSDVETALDLYADVAVARSYRPSATLDDQLAQLDALIRLYCERACANLASRYSSRAVRWMILRASAR